MTSLYICVHAAEFPAQALLRLRPDRQREPVVVMDGQPPHEYVCALNQHAQRCGAGTGMTRLDVEALPGVLALVRTVETEAAARTVFFEAATKFSPRVEEVSEGTSCSFVLDITGTERLFGPPEHLADRMRVALAAAGFRVSMAVSANFHAARIKAAAGRGISLIPEGEESVSLAKLPVTTLGLSEKHCEIFALWGIRTLGELAALPEVELIARLGQEAEALRQLAMGKRSHLFQPIVPEFTLAEYFSFETPVEEIDSLLFMGARMIELLVRRATDRALSIAFLTVRLKLDNDQVHELVLRPAVPSTDRKFILKLLQLEVGANPPQAAVVSLELMAEAGQSATVQLGLFTPQTPEPSRLDVTLARLRALVGTENVGSPALEDSHRPGNFHMQSLVLRTTAASEPETQRTVLRRLRPPVPVIVTLRDAQPASFSDLMSRFSIKAAFGPWKSSGCWWAAGQWNVEEWDVLAERADGSSLACLLVCDEAHTAWQLEAVYD